MNRSLFAAAAVTVALASPARADDLKSTARAVATKTQTAIVTARLVVKISFGEREQEQKLEITGTVIDASGLTVVSAAAIDPTARLQGLMGGRRGGGGGGGEQQRIDTEVSETALVLEDGTELEADVVLKDADLDLAFIKPRDTKGAKLDFVELKASDAKVQALDDVFVVGRLGRVANHAVSIATGEVKAVVKGPRSFYVLDNEISSGATGCVAYAADGTALGVFVTRTVRGDAGGFRGRGGDQAVIVRPVADVLELAKQALSAKAPEKSEKKKSEDKDEDDSKKKDKEKKPADDKKKGDDF